MATKTRWTIDAGHSQIQFKIKHLAIANVTGSFRTFRGEVESNDEDFHDASVQFEMETASIDTNNSQRDKDLVSNLFFDSEKFPLITFKGILDNDKLKGDLTILETTKQVALDVEHTGIGKGRFNDIRAGFELTGKINRKDFGLNFSLLTEAGSLVVGEDVKIQCAVELIKQPKL